MIRATIGILAGTGRKPVALAATGVGETSFTANWEAFEGAVYYLLDVSTQQDFSTFVYENEIIYAPTTSYVVIGLEDNTTYYYRLRASTEPLYLLDEWQYPDAAAAYSLRKLRHEYKGAAVEVRNDGGVHLDIGFDENGDLDTAALLAHCGSGDGTVSKWYDQSGDSRDASQTTVANQPQIVSSGSVILENGEPSLSFDGTDDYLLTGSVLDVNGLSNLYFFTVVQTDNTAYAGNSNKAIFWMAETGSWGQIHNSLTQTQVAFRFGTGQSGNEQSTTITSSTSMRLLSLYKNNTVDRVDVNGDNKINYTSALGTIANTSNVFNIGRGLVQYMPMNLSELIYYPSDQSSNRSGIETNINTHYSIYYVSPDADAQAFFDRVDTAGGTLTSTEEDAIGKLVFDLKAAGIWTKMKALYPMVGASAAACAQNLKSSSFTASFNGGFTYTTDGAQGNGTTGYINTNFNASDELTTADCHLSIYQQSATNNNVNGIYYGPNFFIYFQSATQIWSAIGYGQSTATNATTRNGMHTLTAVNSSAKLFEDTSQLTTFTSSGSFPDFDVYINSGATTNNAAFTYGNGIISYASLGVGLTDTDVTNLYNAVQAFNTTLSREV